MATSAGPLNDRRLHSPLRSGAFRAAAGVVGSWIGLGMIVGWTLPCPPSSSPLAQGLSGAIVFAILGTVLARCGARSSNAWLGAGAGVMVAAAWGILSPAGMSRIHVCLSLIAGGLVASLAGARITAFVGLARSVASFRPLRRLAASPPPSHR